jgi:hypothetical protein
MIATGFLGSTPYEVYVLNESHIPQLMNLQYEVIDALENKAILQPLDEQELRYILSGNGIMIGVFVQEKLIAFRALLEPALDEEHLGYDIGLSTENELKKVLYQEISNVHPNFRGYGLQRTMADIIMQQVDITRFNIVCATVMPGNIASLKDKFSQGMHIANLKYKYGGKLRYVFAKSLKEQTRSYSREVFLDMKDTKEQQRLLKEGYVGLAMQKDGENWLVQYVK